MSAADRPVARLNDVGDVVLEEARQLRALADPGRLAVFDWLQKHGPSAGADVAAGLGLDGASVTEALTELDAAGLVTGHAGRWEAAGRGLFLQLPEDDAEALAAARQLSNLMLLAVEDLPREWVAEVEPGLEPAWARAAGFFNAGVVLSTGELTHVQEELERVLEPFLNRRREDAPSDARKVRVLGYFLPGAQPG
jgi:DNA-binding transcriptional ArsR family regulator